MQFSAILRTFFLILVTILAGVLIATAQDTGSQDSNAKIENNNTVTETEQAAPTNLGKNSQLPIPRFVSLKFDKINVRIGPDSYKYKIAWVYKKKGLPVEIIAEYDQWRRIRDANGETGWVNGGQLDGRRTAMTAPWVKDDQLFVMRKTPDNQGILVAEVQSGVIGNVRTCDGMWCEMEIQGYRGFLKQMDLWGVYPGEKITK